MPQEYVPGKCNIGPRGRTLRVSYGLAILAIFVSLDLLSLGSISPLYRLVFLIPFYVGFLGVLMGTMSFCVMVASRGAYNLHSFGMRKSSDWVSIESAEWRRRDRNKARIVNLEALAAGVLLAALLALV